MNLTKSNFILLQRLLDGPGGHIGVVVLVLHKDEGGVVVRLFLREVAVPVGEVDQALQILELLPPPQLVHIGEHGPEVGAPQALDGHGF